MGREWSIRVLGAICLFVMALQAAWGGGPGYRVATDYAGPGSLTGGIQEAIDSLTEGGTVYVPEGTYLLHRPIKLKPETKLVGAGKATALKKDAAFRLMLAEDAKRNQDYVVVADTSKLRKGMAIAIGDEVQKADIWGALFLITRLEGKKVFIDHIRGGGGLRSDLSTKKNACMMNLFMNILPDADCIICDLEVDGNAGEQRLEDAIKFATYGMLLGGIYPLRDATKVERCWIHDSGYDGIQVNGRDTRVTILNCNIYSNRGNGIHTGGGPETIISHCNIYDNQGGGVYFCFGNRKLIVTDNLIYRNGHGIGGINTGDLERDATADRYSVISNNIIYENKYAGITSRFGASVIGPRDFVILGNIVKNNQQARNRNISIEPPAGIVLQNAQRCIVSNNRCFDDQDGFPRSLAADAKAGESVIKTIGMPAGEGTGSVTLRPGSQVMISDKDHGELRTIEKVRPHRDFFQIKLEGKLVHSYKATKGGRVVGTKTQQWGIACYWWGSNETGYHAPELCNNNLISNNVCLGNAIGGILWSGAENVISNNIGKVAQIDERKAFEESLYPTRGSVKIANPGFEGNDGWRLSKEAGYDEGIAHSGKRCLKLAKAEEGGVADAVSEPIALKANTRYRLSGWVRSTITKDQRTALPYLFLYAEREALGSRARLPFEPTRDYSFSPESGAWEYVRAEAVTGAKRVEARIHCRLEKAAGEVWFDDVKLEELD